MPEIQPRDGREALGGALVGLLAIGILLGHWQYGVDWQNPAIVAWLGTVTAVCLGVATYAVGLVTGEYYRRQSTYRRILSLFGTVALVAGGAFVTLAVLV